MGSNVAFKRMMASAGGRTERAVLSPKVMVVVVVVLAMKISVEFCTHAFLTGHQNRIR